MSALHAWALATVALFIKIFVVALLQGFQRVRHDAYAKPEDAAFFGKGTEVREAELPIVERAQGALRNDGENIPIFLALSLAYVLLECWPVAASLYFGGFVLARTLHSVFMIWPRQPHRNIAYVTGILIMLTISSHIIYTIISI